MSLEDSPRIWCDGDCEPTSLVLELYSGPPPPPPPHILCMGPGIKSTNDKYCKK